MLVNYCLFVKLTILAIVPDSERPLKNTWMQEHMDGRQLSPSTPLLPPPAMSPSVVDDINGVGVRDFTEEKKPGSHADKGDKHGEGLEPQWEIRVKVERHGHKEGAGENGNARDLPVELVVIEPEGTPALEAKSHPPDL